MERHVAVTVPEPMGRRLGRIEGDFGLLKCLAGANILLTLTILARLLA